jgi:hypothetical protein
MASETKPTVALPKPGTTAHKLAQYFIGTARGHWNREELAIAVQKMAENIQVGIDYEVARTRIELGGNLLKYRKALEEIQKVTLIPSRVAELARDALKD